MTLNVQELWWERSKELVDRLMLTLSSRYTTSRSMTHSSVERESVVVDRTEGSDFGCTSTNATRTGLLADRMKLGVGAKLIGRQVLEFHWDRDVWNRRVADLQAFFIVCPWGRVKSGRELEVQTLLPLKDPIWDVNEATGGLNNEKTCSWFEKMFSWCDGAQRYQIDRWFLYSDQSPGN